jgi:hydroxyethylthiazole kinase
VDAAALSKAREALRTSAPLVHCLTNTVVQTITANALLAAGAAPAMVDAPQEAGEFAAIASAVLINVGTVHERTAEAMRLAARAAGAAGTPWVLDPVAVGAGAPEYDAFVKSLLQFKPAIIRGNASELIALGGGAALGKGVETTASSADAVEAVGEIARATGAVVAVSGPVDYITDGTTTVAVPGGDVRLTKVTGAGCSLGALCAGALAAGNSPFLAAQVAHAAYAVAAERAGARTQGTGAFAVALVDELSLLTA